MPAVPVRNRFVDLIADQDYIPAFAKRGDRQEFLLCQNSTHGVPRGIQNQRTYTRRIRLLQNFFRQDKTSVANHGGNANRTATREPDGGLISVVDRVRQKNFV